MLLARIVAAQVGRVKELPLRLGDDAMDRAGADLAAALASAWATACRNASIADLQLGLPILLLVFAILIPLIIVRPLLAAAAAQVMHWPLPELGQLQAVTYTGMLIVYFLFLKFVITRV